MEYPNVKPSPKIVDAKSIPNVKPIEGNYLYMAETEVTNKQYKDFLYWLKKNKPENYISNLPDTANWGILYFGEPYKDYYFRHPAYNNFPLVNISQNQAVNYCNWLHDSLQKYFASIKSNIVKFIVRLPTEKEWMMAARGGLPEGTAFPWKEDGIWNYDKKRGKVYSRLNCNKGYTDYAGKLFEPPFITTEVKSYWPNGFGLYNMSGNVAEWISEKAKSKGGSWGLPPYNARIDVPGYRNGDSTAKPDIGFRYIIEIVSVKDEIKSVTFDNKYFSSQFLFIPDIDTILETYHFASKTEVTNAEYQTFLTENNQSEFQIDHKNWNLYFPYEYYEMYGQTAGYGNYPVVNISYQAALAYCSWLSNKYNALEKRKYKKVTFRLPSENEWESLAKGGRNYQFPWGGPYTRNSKGYYLANYCPLEDQFFYKADSTFDQKYPSGYFYNYPNADFTISRGIDGSIIPTRVEAYFPNDYGLYNCSGNVAEMINEYGITKGGSWNSYDYLVRITSKEKYTEPSPIIGFRVLMEVLER
jgi:formylglycine-generating enzyme required for sulfatase activity